MATRLEKSFDSIGEDRIESSLGVVKRHPELRPCVNCKTLTYYVWEEMYNGQPAHRVSVCSETCMVSNFPTQYILMLGRKKENRNAR